MYFLDCNMYRIVWLLSKVKKPDIVSTTKEHLDFLESRLQIVEIAMKIKTEDQIDTDPKYSKA